MAVGEVVNASDVGGLVDQILPVMLDKLSPFITIFKAVGVVLAVYIIYLIYRSFVRISDRRRMKRIEEKVLEIDAKLERLFRKKDKAEKKKKKK